MKCFGILPMAGKGTRIQPIPFSKELYPLLYQGRHFPISQFSISAMQEANVDEIKLVVSPEKTDIIAYYAKSKAPIAFYLYDSPSLPESCLFPLSGLHDEDICLFGLPDTLFSPKDSYRKLRHLLENGADIGLGLFRTQEAVKFDSVQFDKKGNVLGVLVKKSPPLSDWIWGIWGARVKTLKVLKKTILRQRPREGNERLLGVGFNTLAKIETINFKATQLGGSYFDIGTVESVLRVNAVLQDFQF